MKTFNVLCYFKDSKALQIDFREFAKLRYFKGFKNFNDLKELIPLYISNNYWTWKPNEFKNFKASRAIKALKILMIFKDYVV